MIPAQSSGAAPARSRFGRDAQDKVFVDDNALGVAAVGYSSEVLVGRMVGEGHVRAELFKGLPTMMAGAIRVDHAADSYEVAMLCTS